MMSEDLLTIIRTAEEKIKADGCTGCTFIKTDEWEMPCAKCRRNCKDYWRNAYRSDNSEGCK